MIVEPKLLRTARFALVVDGRLVPELGVFRRRADALDAAALYRRRPEPAAGRAVVTLRRVWVAV